MGQHELCEMAIQKGCRLVTPKYESMQGFF